MRLELESVVPKIILDRPAENKTPKVDNAAAAKDFLAAGIKAAQEGSRAKARAALLRAVEVDPRSESGWLWLASISEYPEELLVFLTNVLEINPENRRALDWTAATKSLLSKTFVQRGIDAIDEQRGDYAQQCFNQALEYDQSNALAWLWLASLSESYEGKVTYYERVLAIDPANEAALAGHKSARDAISQRQLAEARAAAVTGRTAEANEFLDAIIAENPDSEDAWILRSHLAAGFETKIDAFRRVLELNPQNATARSGLDSLLAIIATVQPAVSEPSIQTDNAKTAPECHADRDVAVIEAEAAVADHNDNFQSEDAAAIYDQDAASAFVSRDEPRGAYIEDGETTQQRPAKEDTAEEEHGGDHGLASEAVCQPIEAAEPAESYEFAPESVEAAAEQIEQPAEPEVVECSASVIGLSDLEIADDPSIHETLPAPFAEPHNADGHTTTTAAATDSESSVPVPDFVSENVHGADLSYRSEAEGETFSHVAFCPFCNTENETHSAACPNCMAVLTLADLELLVASGSGDKVIVRDAVERMELNAAGREISESDLITLAVGHLNLRDLETGVAYLKRAANANPTNAVLAGHVASLIARMGEIKRLDEMFAAGPKSKTILVVDDSPTVRKLIAGKLEKSGHDVVCAADGVEALDRLREVVPDLILLDITMPRMDGYQVCKMIRSGATTQHIPVVMISGKDGFFDKVRGRMAGSSGYITKPFGPETLMKAVETYLAGEGVEEMVAQ